MKKLVGFALAGIFLSVYQAPLYAVDIHFDGDFRVRGFYDNNLTDAHNGDKNLNPVPAPLTTLGLSNCANSAGKCNDEEAFNDLRFRLRTTITAGMTSGVVTLDLANGFPGTDVATFQSAGNSALSGAAPFLVGTGDTRFGIGFGNSYNVVGVREAYLKIDPHEMFGLTLGRQLVKLGHGLILDDTVGAIEAHSKLGPFNLMLADAVICDSNALGINKGTCFAPGLAGPTQVPGGTGGDTDLYIGQATFSHMDHHQLGLFVTYLNDRRADTLPFFGLGDQSGDLWTLGATADGKMGPMNLNLEFDYLTGTGEKAVGQDDDVRGYNLFANLGIDVGPANVSLTGLYTSGVNANDVAHRHNANSISGNFALGNILLNNTERSDRDGGSVGGPMTPGTSVSGGNQVGGSGFDGLGMTAVKLGASVNPMPKLGTDVAVIWAQTSMTAPVTPVVPSPSRSLGVELDANAHYKLDQNATVFAGIGYLFVGDAWKAIYQDQSAKDNMIKANIGVSYKF